MDLQRLSRLCRTRLASTSVKTRCCSFTSWLNKEEKKIEDIANDFNLNTNGPATEDIKNQLRDAERKAEAAAQERDQAAQAVEDADRDAASLFE